MMKKLNEVIYNKLLLQANEAKAQGMERLATGVLNSLGAVPEDEEAHYIPVWPDQLSPSGASRPNEPHCNRCGNPRIAPLNEYCTDCCPPGD